MRNIIAVILVFSVICGNSQDNVKGLYLHFSDYATGKITYLKKSQHVKLHDGLYRPYIEIIDGDSIRKVAKDTMFGYLDKNGNACRFYKKQVFPVLLHGELILYKMQPPQNKVCMMDAVYYFSRSSISDVRELNRRNLKKEYSDNKLFLDLLNELNDDQLHEFDENSGDYRINVLLKQSGL